MASTGQDSRTSLGASNAVRLGAWRALARACRVLPGAADPRTSIRELLRHTLDATGAERAFLVSSRAGPAGVNPATVEASVSLRDDGGTEPSRTIVERALFGKRAVISLDASSDRRFLAGESVRKQRIRLILATRVPRTGAARTALVLDGRAGGALPGPQMEDLLEGFAGLVALASPSPETAAPTGSSGSESELVGKSKPFLDLLDQVRLVAKWELPVLVTGESGSGKEGIVRRLHEGSHRRAGPLVALNCAAVPEGLLEAELFGAVQGAYTGLIRDRPGLFRLAHEGTLFLDEIGDMAPAMQAKLLRVLQNARVRPVGGEKEERADVRVVAATHRNLESLVARGRFRDDLYYRLATIELRVPPLRERPDDIPLLIGQIGIRLARRTGYDPVRCAPTTIEALQRYSWPGNVRQLESILVRALIRSGGREVFPHHLDLPARFETATTSASLEHQMVEAALRDSDGVLTRAAARIGWSRQKLLRRMMVLGIRRS